jgi:acyl carrier protein
MKAVIREYIEQEFLFGKGTVQDNERLFDKGIIDSLGFLKLLAFIEKTFQISLDMSEISMDKFGSVAEITQMVKQKKQAPENDH